VVFFLWAGFIRKKRHACVARTKDWHESVALTSLIGGWTSSNPFWVLPQTGRARLVGSETPFQSGGAVAPGSIFPIIKSLTEIREDVVAAIGLGKHEFALDLMMSIVSSSSKMLADASGKTALWDDSTQSVLVQQLKDDGVIADQEWNRLTVLLMCLGGLDVQVGEFGEALEPGTIKYALEYHEIVRQILSRLKVETPSESVVLTDSTGNQIEGYRAMRIALEYTVPLSTYDVTNSSVSQSP
jgi:hypothetical protein